MDETNPLTIQVPESVPVPRRFRFTMGMAMLLVIPAAAASALFAKLYQHIPGAGMPYVRIDAPILFVLSIVLTAIALGSLKGHSAGQMMLQVTLACGGYVGLITMMEAGLTRPLLYWFQISFAILVTLPMAGRRYVKVEMERGPRRTLWKNRCEAVFFSFLTMLLVLVGVLLQFMMAFFGSMNVLKF